MNSPPVFSGVRVTRSLVLCVCFVDRSLSFCTFSFDHCAVCSSSIYGLWLPLYYLQTLLNVTGNQRTNVRHFQRPLQRESKRHQDRRLKSQEAVLLLTTSDMVAATHPIKKKALSLLLRTLFTIRRRHTEHGTCRAEGNYQRNTANPTHNSNTQVYSHGSFFSDVAAVIQARLGTCNIDFGVNRQVMAVVYK